MKKTIKDPFADLVLDSYEQEIEDAVPKDKKILFDISKKEKADFAEIAAKHRMFKTSKRINIRINNEDLARVRAKAKRNSIPYQTLLSSLIHKYAEGDFTITL